MAGGGLTDSGSLHLTYKDRSSFILSLRPNCLSNLFLPLLRGKFGIQLFKQFVLTSAEGEESPGFLVAGMTLDKDYNCDSFHPHIVIWLISL